jgi:ATP-dependent Clp protease ATP-binding subunit ClpA
MSHQRDITDHTPEEQLTVPSFSNTLEHAIHSALALANERSHEFATLEHQLLALIDEPEASQVLKA